MKTLEILKGQSGASVVAIALIIAVITSLGIVFVSLFSTGLDVTVSGLNSVRAIYVAEAGAEAASARLKADWTWRNGYLGKAFGPAQWGAAFDVETLQTDLYPSQTAASPYCVTFSSELVNTGANPARSILVRLSWNASVNPADLGAELYNTDVSASCAAPGTLPVATSQGAKNPELIRYRIPEPGSFPTTVTYTARVTGNAGGAHSLSIMHPDVPGFSTSNTTRGIIALGRSADSRREAAITVRRE